MKVYDVPCSCVRDVLCSQRQATTRSSLASSPSVMSQGEKGHII
jgi:hypothetical protein